MDLLQPVAAMPSRLTVLPSAITDSLFVVSRTRLLFGERAFQFDASRRGNSCLTTSVVSTTLTLKNSHLFIHKVLFLLTCFTKENFVYRMLFLDIY